MMMHLLDLKQGLDVIFSICILGFNFRFAVFSCYKLNVGGWIKKYDKCFNKENIILKDPLKLPTSFEHTYLFVFVIALKVVFRLCF